MPRIGRHPLKIKGLQDENLHQALTVGTIVHIPQLDGYWKYSFDVLKSFFAGLFSTVKSPFDMMVFDNGSCEEVREYLTGRFAANDIQTLILSTTNLKKLAALEVILAAAKGDDVAYADCDVRFFEGWLEESLRVFEAFPQAGRVTSSPIAGGDVSERFEHAIEAASMIGGVEVDTGELIPTEYIRAHALSLGQSMDEYRQRFVNRCDVRISRGGTSAYFSGADFQFTISREALRKVLPLEPGPAEYYDPIYSPVLEKKLEDAGFWILSTEKYLVHHMGNHLPNYEDETPFLRPPDDAIDGSNVRRENSRARPMIQSRIVRKLLQKVHLATYRLLYR